MPFLDHDVAEYAAGIPMRMKINGMREKHVLREATRDVIIEPVYNREKHPFTTPPAQRENDVMLELFWRVSHLVAARSSRSSTRRPYAQCLRRCARASPRPHRPRQRAPARAQHNGAAPALRMAA